MVILLSQQPRDRGGRGASAPPGLFGSPVGPKTLAPLKRALREAARTLDLPALAQVSVLLAADPFVQELNARYRGIDSPTDVLSFAQDDNVVLGDIAISVETARRQALGAGWPLASELALLAVHGLLHLAGMDDQAQAGARQMEEITRAVLVNSKIALPEQEHPFFQNI